MLAAREEVHRSIGIVAHANSSEGSRDPFGDRCAVESSTAQREREILAHRGHNDLCRGIAEDHADALAQELAFSTRVQAVDARVARCYGHETVEDPRERGFTGPVRADHGDPLCLEGERQVAQHGSTFTNDGHVVEIDSVGLGHRIQLSRVNSRRVVRPRCTGHSLTWSS